MEDDEQGEQDEDCAREEGRELPDAGHTHCAAEDHTAAGLQLNRIFQEGGVQAVGVDADVQIVDEGLDDLAEGEGHNGKVVAVEPQDRDADQQTDDRGQQRAACERDDKNPSVRNAGAVECGGDHRSGEGADAHESGVSEGKLAEHADREVQRQRHDDIGADRHKLPL